MTEYLDIEHVIGLHDLAAGPGPVLDRDTLHSAVMRPQLGRWPCGPALVQFVEEYQQRAGLRSGLVPSGGRAPIEQAP